MSQVLTSRVFLAIEAAYKRLEGLSFPPYESAGVSVYIGATGTEGAEYVAVGTAPSAPVSQEQRTSNRRNEEIPLRFVVQSDAVHKDSLSALRRLGQLVAVVEAAFRDQDTGAPIPLDEVDGLGTDVVLNRATSLTIDPRVYPLPSGGWGAQATVDLPITTRI